MASSAAPPAAEEDKNTQLLNAAADSDAALVRQLLASGADAAFVHDPPGVWGSRNKKGPLHVALKASRHHQGWSDTVRALVEAGADVNAICESFDWRGCGSRKSAFELALPAAMQDAELLELFLRAGADPNIKCIRDVHSMRTDGRSQESVLHQSAAAGRLEVARKLLEAGAQVDAVASEIFHNERGYDAHTEETALHRACGRGDVSMCALLIAHGANVNAVRKYLEHVESGLESPTDDPREDGFVSQVICVPVEETALHMAIRAKSADLVAMLRCAGADAAIERVYGDDSLICEGLCEGSESLLRALRAAWTPETHKVFPAEVRESIKATLLASKRQDWPLRDEALFRVFAMAA